MGMAEDAYIPADAAAIVDPALAAAGGGRGSMNDDDRKLPMTRQFLVALKEKVSHTEAQLERGCCPLQQEELLAVLQKSKYYLEWLESGVEGADQPLADLHRPRFLN
jgi:hypothetical protein